ncbi:MAG TPA: PLP-dependent aminotransferase family protein [Thermoanaerobaculia bacterium]|jgi:DNA-binding transcriptional MocR family regulator|nr:PLP-dependent aminotransferase family protein [Thermoanaerobaculia bacterium]
MTIAAFLSTLGRWTEGSGPVYARLARAIRSAVERGEMRPGERLPSERVLAERLAVSRTTVVSAYEELRRDRVLESRQGSGTRVAGAPARPPGLLLREDPSESFRRHPVWRSLTEGAGGTIEFLGAHLPAPELLAREASRIDEKSLREVSRGPGYLPMGLPALRQAIARHLEASGLPTTEDQVLVTHGAQQAIGLAAALLCDRGDAVLIEDPTYLGSIDIFSGRGVRLVTTPVGGDAAWVARLRETIVRTAPRLVYLMPTFQNPTGAVMPEPCRRSLARLSRDMQVPIVEDNTLADLSLAGRPPAPIAAFDAAAPILTIGSLSKLFWGGLRIGWIRASDEILQRITRLKIMADLGGSVIGQLVAVKLLAEAERVRAIRRREMRERLDRLTKLLSRHLPDWSWEEPAGGLSLWVRLPRGDASAFAQAALRHGVAVVPGALASPTGGCADRLRIPYVLDAAPMKEGVERLARAWDAYAGTEKRRSAGVLV